MIWPDVALSRRERSDLVDAVAAQVFHDAVTNVCLDAHRTPGIALVAVGGYGRRELSPHSDVDLVLVHAPSVSEFLIAQVADAIWYPLWERNLPLDHAVRTTDQVHTAAAADYRVAMGMLDVRVVAGDADMVTSLRSAVLSDWRRDARSLVPQVRQARGARVERAGWIAYAATPDLKESGGGLRDCVTVRALVATWLIDVPHTELEQLRGDLLDVRDAVHTVTGRRADRLNAEVIVDVARHLGMEPAALDLHVRHIGRRIAHLSARAWRQTDDALARKRTTKITSTGPAIRRVDDGVAILDGEVIVTRDADPGNDPELALRAAAAAARRGMALNAGSARRLAQAMTDLPQPWSPSSRRHVVDLLTAGPGLVQVWDELDFAGVVDKILPEWAAIRLRGSTSPVHRFTVDRHSVETCVQASRLTRHVSRPDVLAVAALLHDIGKGAHGEHSAAGQPMAEQIARRWGFDEHDATLIGKLVLWHLLLPTTATRRDIEDPATARMVADAVGTEEFLDLLAALTAADAVATSPTAWTSWRRGLIEGLVAKTRRVLASGAGRTTTQYEGWPAHVPVPDFSHVPATYDLQIQRHHDGSLLTVTAPDRQGLMASIAGGLTLAGLQIRSARTITVGRVAASLWEVTRDELDPARVRMRLGPALSGELDIAKHLNPSATGDEPHVRILPDASDSATLIEVRAKDRRGLVWSVCHTIAQADLSIRSAHMSTYGDEVRDVFYVVDASGKPLPVGCAETVRAAVADALR